MSPVHAGEGLRPFSVPAADLDAIIYTDHRGGYNDLGNVGYTHVKTNVSASGDSAHVTMPCVHRVAALLKRWLLGTHQGDVSIRQLDFCLDEFVFRSGEPRLALPADRAGGSDEAEAREGHHRRAA